VTTIIDTTDAASTLTPEHFAWLGDGVLSVTFLPLLAEGQTLGWLALAMAKPGGRSRRLNSK
jgi:hypothetical protein